MPQLESSMFVDQISFMSLIFFLSHIYNTEVILPNISMAKQYREKKLGAFIKHIKAVATYNIYTGARERLSMFKRFRQIENEAFKAEVSTILFYTRCITKQSKIDSFLAKTSLSDVKKKIR